MKRLVFLCLGVFVLGLACGKNPVKPKPISIKANLMVGVVDSIGSYISGAEIMPYSGPEERFTSTPRVGVTGPAGVVIFGVVSLVDPPRDFGVVSFMVVVEADTTYYPPGYLKFYNKDSLNITVPVSGGGP